MDDTLAAAVLDAGSLTIGGTTKLRAAVGELAPAVRLVVSRTLAGQAGALARAHLDFEDATQDILTKLLEGRLPTQRSERPGHLLRAWIRTMAVNWCRDVLRRPAHARVHRESAHADGVRDAESVFGAGAAAPDPIQRAQLVSAVDDCADRLSHHRRRLWDQLLVDPDASLTELAVGLDYPVAGDGLDPRTRDAIYTLRSVTRRQMAACLEAAGFGEYAQNRRPRASGDS